MKHETLISLLFTAVLLFLFHGCNTDRSESLPDTASTVEQQEEPALRSIIQKTVPDYTFSTLEGENLSISDYHGKILLLNFWATWCAPCIREIPELMTLKEKYADEGFEIIGISLDEEGFSVVESFMEQFKFELNYPIVHDDYTFANMTGGIFALPTTYIIDRNGTVVSRRIGEVTMEDIEPGIIMIL